MKAGRVYLDTSAYLSLLLQEKDCKEIAKKIDKKMLCSSTLLLVEAERTLIHLVRHQKLPLELYEHLFERLLQDRELFILRDLTPDLALIRVFPPARTPRSSDLVHLRTARWFQDTGGLERFISLDVEQSKAAKEIGLPI